MTRSYRKLSKCSCNVLQPLLLKFEFESFCLRSVIYYVYFQLWLDLNKYVYPVYLYNKVKTKKNERIFYNCFTRLNAFDVTTFGAMKRIRRILINCGWYVIFTDIKVIKHPRKFYLALHFLLWNFLIIYALSSSVL